LAAFFAFCHSGRRRLKNAILYNLGFIALQIALQKAVATSIHDLTFSERMVRSHAAIAFTHPVSFGAKSRFPT